MSTTDAANLFIALGATDVTREAGTAVKKFRSLPGLIPGDSRGAPDDSGEQRLQAWLKPVILKPANWNGGDTHLKDLGSFVQFLLDESVSGGLTKFLRGIPVEDRSRRIELSREEFLDQFPSSLYKPADQVVIGTERDVWSTFVFDRMNPFVYFQIKSSDGDEESYWLTVFFGDPERRYDAQGDLRVEAKLGQTSIQALGSTLRGLKIPSKLKRLEEIEAFLFSKDAT